MARFYRFVLAIDHFSKPIKRRGIDLDDPVLAEYPPDLRPKYAKLMTGIDRNPRTCDEKGLKEKILLAIKRNHPNFNGRLAEKLAGDYAKKAVQFLNALWYSKHVHLFPDKRLERQRPSLK
jgi:hypothetical protein